MDGKRNMVIKAYVDAGLFHAVNSQAHRERLTTSELITRVLEDYLDSQGVPRLRSMMDSEQLADRSELQLVDSPAKEG